MYHEKYLNYLKTSQSECITNQNKDIIEHCKSNGYQIDDRKMFSIKKIQRYFKKKYLGLCINESDIKDIPPLYRFRVAITNYHVIEYSEENIEDTIINMHRFIHEMFKPLEKQYVLFRYCFDIRILYYQRNNILELQDGKYYLQPSDHIRINKLWKKVNGSTDESIIFLSRLEYIKSLSIDKYGF